MMKLLLSAAAVAPASAASILDQRVVDQINAASSGATWTAELSPRFADTDKEDAFRMLGVTELYDGEDTMGGAISWAPRPHLRNKVRVPPLSLLSLSPPASRSQPAAADLTNRLTLACCCLCCCFGLSAAREAAGCLRLPRLLGRRRSGDHRWLQLLHDRHR